MPMKQEKDLQLNNKKKNPAPRKKNSGAAAGKVRKALKPSDGTAKKKEKNAPQNSKPHKQKGAAKPEKSKKTLPAIPFHQGKNQNKSNGKNQKQVRPKESFRIIPLGGMKEITSR